MQILWTSYFGLMAIANLPVHALPNWQWMGTGGGHSKGKSSTLSSRSSDTSQVFSSFDFTNHNASDHATSPGITPDNMTTTAGAAGEDDYLFSCYGFDWLPYVFPEDCQPAFNWFIHNDHRQRMIYQTASNLYPEPCNVTVWPMQGGEVLNTTYSEVARMASRLVNACMKYGRGGFYNPTMTRGNVWTVSVAGGPIPAPNKLSGTDSDGNTVGINPAGLGSTRVISSNGVNVVGVD